MAKDPWSDLRKAYAAATGVSLRTAQRHSNPDDPHPDWQRFVGTTAAHGVAQREQTGEMTPVQSEALGSISPFRPEDMPEFYNIPDEELHPVQRLEKQAWELHARTFRDWQAMVGSAPDQALAVAYARELPKLRKNFDEARRERETWEVEQRIVVTLPEFQAFEAKFLGPLAELLKNIPMELANEANPSDPAFARKKMRDWLRDKAEPRIVEMLEAARELKPAA